MSMQRTRCPSSAKAAARFSVVVVLATPPFWLAKAITLAPVTSRSHRCRRKPHRASSFAPGRTIPALAVDASLSVVPESRAYCSRRPMLFRSSFAVAVSLCALAPTAHAATSIRFNSGGPGPASIVVSDNRTTRDGYIELVRGREVLARSLDRDGIGASSGYLNVPDLIAGDVARAYGNGALLATATYAGGPRIGAGACAGSTAFTVARGEGTPATWVGTYLPGGALVPGQRLTWADSSTFTVAAEPALAAGQIVRVLTKRFEG